MSTLASNADQKKQICGMRYLSLHAFQEVLLQASSNLVLQTEADAAH